VRTRDHASTVAVVEVRSLHSVGHKLHTANFADLEARAVNAPSIVSAEARSCPPGTLVVLRTVRARAVTDLPPASALGGGYRPARSQTVSDAP
jgi:hypothetical protein